MEPIRRDISSEDDLWSVLEDVLGGPHIGYEPHIDYGPLHIHGWRPELLYFPDEEVPFSVSPSAARALTEFHASLSRAYAYLLYRQPVRTVLKADDKDNLEIKVLLVKGSNGYEVFDGALEKLVQGAIEKMTGHEMTVGIVVFLLLYFGASFARHWISEHYAAKRHSVGADERVKLSDQETKRAQIMANALARHSDLRPLADASDEGKHALVRAVTHVPKARVVGADVDQDIATTILSRPREERHGKRLDGKFEVIILNTENPEGFTCRLKDLRTNEEITAEINYADLTDDDINALFAAAREKKPIHLLVNAWFIGDKVSRAVIMRANP